MNTLRPGFWLMLAVTVALTSLVVSDASAAPIQTKGKSTKKKPIKKKKAPVKKKPLVKKPAPKPVDPLNAPVVGTWFLVDSEDKFVKTTKITFSRYGEFDFVGSAWRSKGNFRFRDGNITLSWTSIDNKPVAPGTMKKVLPVSEQNRRLQLDRFRYGKFS